MSSKKQKDVLVAHKIKILVEQGTLLSDVLVLDLPDFTASLHFYMKKLIYQCHYVIMHQNHNKLLYRDIWLKKYNKLSIRCIIWQTKGKHHLSGLWHQLSVYILTNQGRTSFRSMTSRWLIEMESYIWYALLLNG